MSSTGLQLVREKSGVKERSPMAHLLHALNQPLTGLQCSLELGLVGKRSVEHYLRALEAGLQLTSRMRLLVEALREIVDMEEDIAGRGEVLVLQDVVAEIVEEIRPVAVSRGGTLFLQSGPPIHVRADRQRLTATIFRQVESAVSLAWPGSEVRMTSSRDDSDGWLMLEWREGERAETGSLSRAELGLLVAAAAWEQMGAAVENTRLAGWQKTTVRVPLQGPVQAADYVPAAGDGDGI